MYKKLTFDSQIDLIKTTIAQDEYANEVETEFKTTVFADIKGVYSSDFYNALGKGVKPAFVAKVNEFEYSKEKYVEYDGSKYKVERTFPDGDGIIELTCSEVTS